MPKLGRKPKLTDAERHKRFVEMAKVVGASPDPKDFEKAFKKVISGPKRDVSGPKAHRPDRGAKT
jgi:hypothetical protein